VTETTAAITVRSILREFREFLRRPEVLQPQGWRDGGAKRWAVLTATLVIGLLAVLLPFLGLWQKVFDLPSPDAFGKMDKRWLVPVVVLIAPPIEELLFRGWQRGSAAALWLLGCALVIAVVLSTLTDPAKALTAVTIIALAVMSAFVGGVFLWKRPAPMPWFARAFPGIFYLVAVGFGLVHLTNYPSFRALAVPLILPQVWAGLVLGYIRQRLGLIPGILAHMTANACSISLALLGG
jgi:membrane protease YdiL (CAAX protease family)